MSRLCALEDIAENSSRSFEQGFMSVLVIRRGDAVFVYHNHCPHAAATLDARGQSVLASDGLLLHCERHGAEFVTETGECVSGPCLGESLQALPFTLSAGDIYLD